jgi:hypothetical protein
VEMLLEMEKYQTNHLFINRVVVILSANKSKFATNTQNGWTQDALLRTLFFTHYYLLE